MGKTLFENTFQETAATLLETLEDSLLQLNENLQDAGQIQDVQQQLQGIRDAAASDFPEIAALTGEIEAVFALLITRRLGISRDIVEICLRSVDVIYDMLDETADTALEIRAIVQLLHQIRAAADVGINHQQPPPAPQKTLSQHQHQKHYCVRLYPLQAAALPDERIASLFTSLSHLGECVFRKYDGQRDTTPTGDCWQFLLRTNVSTNHVRTAFAAIDEDCRIEMREISGVEFLSAAGIFPELPQNEDNIPAFGAYLQTDEARNILPDFVAESNAALAEAAELLNTLQTHSGRLPENAAAADHLYRVFHMIKGSAAFLEMLPVVNLTHEAEKRVDQLQQQGVFHPEDLELLVALVDFLQAYLNALQNSADLLPFATQHAQLMHRLLELNSAQQQPATAQNGENTAASTARKNNTDPVLTPHEAASDEGSPSPERRKQFLLESREKLEQIEQNLLSLEEDPANIELTTAVFRAVYALKTGANTLGCRDISRICQHIETFVDKVRRSEIIAEERHFSFLSQVLDFLRIGLDNFEFEDKGIIEGVNGILSLIEQGLGQKLPDAAGENLLPGDLFYPEMLEPAAIERGDVLTLSVNRPEQPPEKQTGEAETAPPVDMPEEASAATNQSALPQLPVGDAQRENTASDAPNTGEMGPAPQPKQPLFTGTGIRSALRIEPDKLKKISELVDEIVLAESLLSHRKDIPGPESAGYIDALWQLRQQVRNLQQYAASLRMIPVSALFRRMQRLVNEAARMTGKRVTLETSGGELEVDRIVLDTLTDALIHLLHNAIDHGIETCPERTELGKNETGVIHLQARQSGRMLHLSVRDDGRGLDRGKILAAAAKRGAVSGSQPGTPDEQIRALILQNGFSTADEVSLFSGRGVGLDVVRKTVDKLRGQLAIDSENNVGTTVTLHIPLPVSIVKCTLFRAGDTLFALPTREVREIVNASERNAVQLPDGREIFYLHGALYPLLRMNAQNHDPETATKHSDGLVVLCETADGDRCIVVDEFVGQRPLVIKPLPDYVRTPGISGCAVLEDGDICLIPDLPALGGNTGISS